MALPVKVVTIICRLNLMSERKTFAICATQILRLKNVYLINLWSVFQKLSANGRRYV